MNISSDWHTTSGRWLFSEHSPWKPGFCPSGERSVRATSFSPFVRIIPPMTSTYNLLTPWSRALFEKLTGSQLIKKFPSFYGTRMFITALTSARHLSLSWARSNYSIPSHPTSWRSILMLSSHLRVCRPICLFPSGLPTKTLHTPLLSAIRATYPVHLILHVLIIRPIMCKVYRSLSSSLCSFLHSPVELYFTCWNFAQCQLGNCYWLF
jgi:hypothetical protein